MLRKLFILSILWLCVATYSSAAKHALVVGISVYPKHNDARLDWRNIHGANDAAIINGTLRRQGFTIAMLTNRQATAAAIRNALKNLERHTTNGDIVYIHFSGHGQPYEDLNGDEADGWDESLVPYDAGQRYIPKVYEGQKHIIDDELSQYVNRIRKKAGRAGYVYVVIDACHIGGASRLEDGDTTFVRGSHIGFSPHGKTYNPKVDRRTFLNVASGKGMSGVCYLEACLATQMNTEIKMGSRYYGALSYYVNKVLQGKTLSKNTSWVGDVSKLMSADPRLLFQDMVVERSAR